MKKAEIKVGGLYRARISGKFVTVRVDAIRETNKSYQGSYSCKSMTTVYDVTNLNTGRKTTFRSAAKFRHEVKSPIMPVPTKMVIIDDPIGMTPEQIISKSVEQAKNEQPEGDDGDEEEEDEDNEDNENGLMTAKKEDEQGDPFETAGAVTDTSARSRGQVESYTLDEEGNEVEVKEGEKSSDPMVSQLTSSVGKVEHTPVSSAQFNNSQDHSDSRESATVQTTAQPTATGLTGLASRIASQSAPTSGRKLTDEQLDIISIAPTVQILVIEAGAGCGKTSTLVEASNAMSGIGQYTAFNSSLVAESKTKFPQRVRCNTIHSLAFGVEGKKYAHRLNGRRVRASEVAGMLGLKELTVDGPDGKPKVLNAGILAAQVTKAIRNFCQSADQEITVNHIPRLQGVDAEHSRISSNRVKEYLLTYARKMWDDKCNLQGEMPFTHDDYVKIWSMNDPYIAADYVLLDEAQDTSPVMLSIMDTQVKSGTRVILVGDSAQQIYSWRGAVNALASFPDAPRKMLSQSFRFGQVIAEVANATLGHLSTSTALVMKGLDSIQSRLDRLPDPDCVLCRTNAGAVSHLLDAIARGKKPHLIGGGDDVLSFVRAVKDLQEGRTTQHPELCCFTSWYELKAFVKTEEGEDLRLMVKIIDQFGCQRILNALHNMPSEQEANIVISTAHKSKGREWKKVKLAGDFKPLDRMDDEEVRLLYVAATRAQHVLDVEECPPFCGGPKRAEEGWNGEGGQLQTVNISGARRLSREIAKSPTINPAASNPPAAPSPAPAGENAPIAAVGPANGIPAADGKPESAEPIYTWASVNGRWCVRGPKDRTGQRVTVARKNGTTSQETLQGVARKGDFRQRDKNGELHNISKLDEIWFYTVG